MPPKSDKVTPRLRRHFSLFLVRNARKQLEKVIKDIDGKMTLHDFRMTPAGETRTNLIFDVVVPSEVKMSHEELNRRITEAARAVNPTYCCVVTFDNDFTGN